MLALANSRGHLRLNNVQNDEAFCDRTQNIVENDIDFDDFSPLDSVTALPNPPGIVFGKNRDYDLPSQNCAILGTTNLITYDENIGNDFDIVECGNLLSSDAKAIDLSNISDPYPKNESTGNRANNLLKDIEDSKSSINNKNFQERIKNKFNAFKFNDTSSNEVSNNIHNCVHPVNDKNIPDSYGFEDSEESLNFELLVSQHLNDKNFGYVDPLNSAKFVDNYTNADIGSFSIGDNVKNLKKTAELSCHVDNLSHFEMEDEMFDIYDITTPIFLK
ncbi:unnamed protein product [Gordionus sp. m RMFG-2023]|uniref:uncharacterized protein LOC135926356 n=1 Tax=Gordionus sp. m RMFG-2023 TaxID=3053472 RepID=UPI0030E3104A